MGLFSFLFGSHNKQTSGSELTASIPADADPHETVSDATMFVPRTEQPAPETDEDDLMTAISTAVKEKTSDSAASSDTLTESIDNALNTLAGKESTAPQKDAMDNVELPTEKLAVKEEPAVTEEQDTETSLKEESPIHLDSPTMVEASLETPEAAANEEESNAEDLAKESEKSADANDAFADWGSNMTEAIVSQSYRKSSIPLFDDEKVRLVWKLKGTGKKRRQRVISECVKDQPVFVICNSNGSDCTIITEEGEELGRLNEQDSTVYHTLVAGNPHNLYIKKIRLKDTGKPTVKILVIVRERRKAPV